MAIYTSEPISGKVKDVWMDKIGRVIAQIRSIEVVIGGVSSLQPQMIHWNEGACRHLTGKQKSEITKLAQSAGYLVT